MPTWRAPLLCALVLLGGSRAAAEQGAFFPTEDQRLGAEEALLAARLRARVQAEAGIAAAAVRLRLPRTSTIPLECPLPPPWLSVAVVERELAHPLGEATVVRLANASGLPSALELQLLRTGEPAPTAPSAPGPAKTLARDLVLGGSLLANVLLACVLLWRLPRRR